MEILLVKPENGEQMKAVKAVLKLLNIAFTTQDEGVYDADFVKKIQESRNQAKEGKLTVVTESI